MRGFSRLVPSPRARPAITRVVWAMWEDIRRELGPEAEQYLPIFSSRLSVLFGKLDTEVRSSSDRKTALDLLVDLIIVSNIDNRHAARLVLDVVRPIASVDNPRQQEDEIERKKKLLSKFRGDIAYRTVGPDITRAPERAEIVASLTKAVRSPSPRTNRTPVIRPSQFCAVEMVAEFMKRRTLLLHEPALSAIVEIPREWIEEKRQSDKYSLITGDFHKRARVDAVIASGEPQFHPLVAVEFDGPDHDAWNRKAFASDDEKEKMERTFQKDQLKNEIFKAAQIPLIRVHYKDFPLGEEWRDDEMKWLFYGMLGAHLTELRAPPKILAHDWNSFKADLLGKHRIDPDGSCLDELGSENPAQHSLPSITLLRSIEMMFPPEEDESVEAVPSNARERCEFYEPEKGRELPFGFHREFMPIDPIESGSVGIKLSLTPGRYLVAAGYTKPREFSATGFFLNVVLPDGHELAPVTSRVFAEGFVKLLVTRKAVRELEDEHDEIMRRYREGIELVEREGS